MTYREHIQPPSIDVKPREDGTRFGHIIKPLELAKQESLEQIQRGDIVIIGAKTDIGVKRNLGNIGAAKGPDHIRRALYTMAFHGVDGYSIFDGGNLVPVGDNLEEFQANLAQVVAEVTQRGGVTMVLGGGHEIAKGQLTGMMQAFPGKSIPVLNIDAHFDDRSLVEGLGNSGTWASEIFDAHREQGLPVHALVYGTQRARNVQPLYRRAEEYGYKAVEIQEIQHDPKAAKRKVERFLRNLKWHKKGKGPLYLSLCFDVVDSSYAPGVSARSPFGLTPREVAQVVTMAVASGQVAAFGLAEVNPLRERFDAVSQTYDDTTAQSAAQVLTELFRVYRPKKS